MCFVFHWPRTRLCSAAWYYYLGTSQHMVSIWSSFTFNQDNTCKKSLFVVTWYLVWSCMSCNFDLNHMQQVHRDHFLRVWRNKQCSTSFGQKRRSMLTSRVMLQYNVTIWIVQINSGLNLGFVLWGVSVAQCLKFLLSIKIHMVHCSLWKDKTHTQSHTYARVLAWTFADFHVCAHVITPPPLQKK